MRGSDEIERTVIVESERLTKEKIETLNHVKIKYEEMLRYVLEFGLKNNITSSLRLKAKLYHELREKYKDLPSHYIHEVCRDTSTRLESFKKKKKKGKTKTEKPEIHKVSIWLDDHLFKQIDDFTIRVTTHKGYTFIPIKPHKLYWKYRNNREWNRAGEIKIKLLDDKAMVYLTFEKEVVEPTDTLSVISVDVNENNVTFKVDNKVYMLMHDIGKTVVSYSSYRQTVQAIKGNRHVSRTVSKNERNKKKDRRRKIAKLIVREAKSKGYSIAV
ncbi:MAG: hypothetical protein JZD40_00950, partial [Sulfolobus sp.]|nr:hypothetical protein [Sulfolobus sp.]